MTVTSAAAGDVDVGSAVADVERGGGVEGRHAGRRAVLVPLQSVLLLLHLLEGLQGIAAFVQSCTMYKERTLIFASRTSCPRLALLVFS